MRIAMIGSKGIPAAISKGGGIEAVVEGLSIRLVERGHKVWVYTRPYANPERKKNFNGVKLITLPTLPFKNFDAFVGTFIASIHCLFQKFDVIHYHGVGPATLSWIPRVFKPSARVVVTFHSRDQFHEKWGALARAYLAVGEWASVTFPHVTTATSHTIQLFCKKMYNADVMYIPNAVEIPELNIGHDSLAQFGLKPDEYFFALSRFVPQKAIEDIIRAYRHVQTNKKLVLIGFAHPAEREYEEMLRRTAKDDPRIIFSGKRGGLELKQLIANGYAMVHASRSEGLSVAILEAMSYQKVVVMSDIPENLELIDHSGISFKVGNLADLARTLQWVADDGEMVHERGLRARKMIKRLYSWDYIISRMESAYTIKL